VPLPPPTIPGARTPLYAALAPDVKGNTFYHNVLGIIGSSSASYDVTRGVPHYDYALEQVKKFTPNLNDDVNLGTAHRDRSAAGAPSINASASKGINGAGFKGEEVNPSSGRLEVRDGNSSAKGSSTGNGSDSGRASMSYDGDGEEVPRRR
jgi:hypothetical protein